MTVPATVTRWRLRAVASKLVVLIARQGHIHAHIGVKGASGLQQTTIPQSTTAGLSRLQRGDSHSPNAPCCLVFMGAWVLPPIVKGSLVCKTSVLRTFNSCSTTTHHTPLITHHSSHTTHHTPLITHYSSHTTHHTPLIIHHASHTTDHTPLIIHHSSHTTHHTLLIIHHSSHTTHHRTP